jgi:uncharacterized protein
MNTKAASAKLRVLFAFFVTLLAAAIACPQDSQPFSINTSPLPPPTGYVNDYVGVIDPATKQQLEQKIKAFKERTNPSVELAVAVIKTTGDREISDYALAIYRGWKIGSKEGDNPGALLLVAIDDRKYFTEVGRDLEDELPDGLVGSLQRQYLVPEFKKGNYAKGISDTIDAYIATIDAKQSGNPTPTPKSSGKSVGSTGSSLFSTVCCLIVIVVILLLIFIPRRRGPTGNDRNRWGGGGFGGGGGGSALPWIVGGIIGSELGGSRSSSGSDWGGSFGGGGGSDWGGFGGGGDAGGGGAGGGW